MNQITKRVDKIGQFRRISPSKASAQVADSIRQAIIRGRFEAGQSLPPERSLASSFGVTRNTVREALRRLEQLRLVSVHHGSGVRVRSYLESTGIEFLVALLASREAASSTLMHELLEARALLGAAVCGHAIERLDLDQLEDLSEAVEDFAAEAAMARPDARALNRKELEIHDQLVRAGGNRALVLLFNSLRHIFERVAMRSGGHTAAPHDQAEHYREVVEALQGGDRASAREIIAQVFALEDEEQAGDREQTI